MKKVFLFLIQALMALSLVFAIGCSKNDSPDEPEKPPVIDTNTPVKDPEGTITANIADNTYISIPNIGFIRWIKPDNFNIYCSSDWYYLYSNGYLASICNLGVMKGLGNITYIPQTGYTTPQIQNISIACEEGHGYVVKFEGEGFTTVYVRLYVVESIINTSGGIMGEKVKYQFPFEP